ncbi:hypothetical protein ACFPIJ_04365 [Dactylosporangium cerinum]|uniref:Uncharacterized protein n=1 Tax=Dactylosporangium cerinum TaxID=1434730 RepID=A0ABV9VL04_9ACTN
MWLKELPAFLRGETAVLRWINMATSPLLGAVVYAGFLETSSRMSGRTTSKTSRAA